MQLTSTRGARRSVRAATPSAWTWTNHPVSAAAIAFLGWLGYVLARYVGYAKGHISAFVVAGGGPHGYVIHHLLLPGMYDRFKNQAGYDGQFYYRLALDPFNWSRWVGGIRMDWPYRYTRIGYPVATWLLSFGQHNLVPMALVLVNLLGVAVMAYFGAIFARDSGRHALWGLAFAAYFGLVISVGRDTAEPLAEALMLGGLIAYRRGRWGWSAAAFAYGAITRETILFAPAAIGLVRVTAMVRRRARPGLADLCWLVPAAAFGIMQVIGKLVVHGQSGLVSDGNRNLSTPFAAMLHAVRDDIAHISTSHLTPPDIALLEYATLAIIVLAGFAVLRVTTAPGHERVAFVLFVLQIVMASSAIWASSAPNGGGGGDFGDGRSFIEPFLLALILLLATPKRYLNTYRLAALLALILPALAIVARRRILYV